MPIVDNLYVDGVSVRVLTAKTKAQSNQAQTAQTTTQTYSDDVSVESILAEKRARIQYRAQREVSNNHQVPESQQQAQEYNPYVDYEQYYHGKRIERQLLGLPSQTKEKEMFDEGLQIQTTMSAVGAGTQLNPGLERSLPKPKEKNIFLESWFENSPWGLFTPEGPPKVSEHPDKKWQILTGKILGEAGDIALWTLTGFGTGKVIATSTRATNIISKLGGTSKVAQATRGILKGLFIGGEAGKAMIMHAQGYTAPEIAIDIVGDVGSFKGFEYGMKKAVEPKLTELAIQEKTHQASQHIVYGERGESIGVGLKGTGEKGWKPTVYSAKTKSISASTIDKQRGWLIEEGMDIGGGKGRVSWIGKIKKFMTSAEFKASGYNPEKPFIVRDVKPGIMGGGRSVAISREILTPKEVLSPATSVSGLAKSQLISAIKSVPWQSLPTLGVGSVTILEEFEKQKKTRKPPQLILLLEQEQQFELKSDTSQIFKEAQEERHRIAPATIMTYKDELIKQVRSDLTPEIREDTTPNVIPDITPDITPEETTTYTPIPIEIPTSREQEAPKQLPKFPSTMLVTFTPKARGSNVIVIPRPPKRPRHAEASRIFGSALWKKSGRKNKNKIFSLNLPKPKNPFVPPKKKRGGRKNGIF
jgi:hypothetical protein